MSKELRKHICLDDSTVPLKGLDFSGFHLRMAYHMEKKQYDDDPYIIDGYGREFREHFKKVALVALNAKCEKDAVTATMKKIKEAGLGDFTYQQLNSMLRAFKEQHGRIAKYICSDFGITAMY
jgi:hypothetical protein